MTWTLPTSEASVCRLCHAALSSPPCCCGRNNGALGKFGRAVDIISACDFKNNTSIFVDTYMLDDLGFWFVGNRDQPPDKHSHAWNSGCAAVGQIMSNKWFMFQVVCGVTSTCFILATYLLEPVCLVLLALLYVALFYLDIFSALSYLSHLFAWGLALIRCVGNI